jgi:hypothetical protein
MMSNQVSVIAAAAPEGTPKDVYTFRVNGMCHAPDCRIRTTLRMTGTRKDCEQAKVYCAIHKEYYEGEKQ